MCSLFNPFKKQKVIEIEKKGREENYFVKILLLKKGLISNFWLTYGRNETNPLAWGYVQVKHFHLFPQPSNVGNTNGF